MYDAGSISAFWDAAASSFDDEADHGLRDPDVREAWARRLRSWLPDSPGDVLDLGCGTGSLSLLLAEHGHRTVGVDLSPGMAARARQKLAAAGYEASVVVGDAGSPPVGAGRPFDAILTRHLLWTLPDPGGALRRWLTLLRPGGRLILIEGRWDVPAEDRRHADGALPWFGGVTAERLARVVRPLVAGVRVEQLTDPGLWGRPIQDERYALVAYS